MLIFLMVRISILPELQDQLGLCEQGPNVKRHHLPFLHCLIKKRHCHGVWMLGDSKILHGDSFKAHAIRRVCKEEGNIKRLADQLKGQDLDGRTSGDCPDWLAWSLLSTGRRMWRGIGLVLHWTREMLKLSANYLTGFLFLLWTSLLYLMHICNIV